MQPTLKMLLKLPVVKLSLEKSGCDFEICETTVTQLYMVKKIDKDFNSIGLRSL
jgi:hypothetical protein